ncbi:MAG: S8 family peptidase [Patescibacteria group bacterium]
MNNKFAISLSRFAFFVFAFISVAALGVNTTSADNPDGAVIPGRYIVVLKDGGDADQATARIEGRHKGIHSDSHFKEAFKGFSVSASVSDASALSSDPDVAAVVPDRFVSIFNEDRPERIDSRLDSDARGSANAKSGPTIMAQTLPTGIDRINAENKSNKGTNVNVAVLDTGILATHPDLSGAVVGGTNCSGGSSSNTTDQNGHGTHVSGTIAGRNNSLGVVGVAPEAKLWAVKVLDSSGSGSWSSVICGLNYVVAHSPAHGGPIKVVNMSLGGTGSSDNNCGNTNNDPLHRAICAVRDAGVTVVVAAGNGNSAGVGVSASTTVPAAYSDAVITVSALADSDGRTGGLGSRTTYGPDDTFATFSNFGSPVSIGAPGVSILSTWLNNSYATLSGTSMATPHVSGAAALYIKNNPSASWSDVKSALVSAGEASGSGHTDPSSKHPEKVLRVDTL